MVARILRRDLRHLKLEHLQRRALLSVSPFDLQSIPLSLGDGLVSGIPTELTGRVTDLYWSAVAQQSMSTVPAIENSLARVDSAGAIQTYIHVAQWSESLLEQLTSQGVTVDHALQQQNLIQAWIPLDNVDEIASLSWVESLDLPSYAVRNVVTSAGDGIVNADDVRSQFAAQGIDGSEIKVGVISDGAEHRADSQSAGELPAITIQRAGYGDEGTAMLEIVHDLAPGAALYFSGYTAPFTLTSADMASTINWMISQDVDVIVDDLGFYGDSYFQDGIVATAASNAIANGITYVTAAGNAAQNHYQASYSQGPAAGSGYWHDFGGGDISQSVTVPNNGSLTAVLQWSDAWGTSANDYDLYLFDANGVPLASSQQVQSGTQNPIEYIVYPNTSGAPVEWQIAIHKYSGQVRELELFTLGSVAQQYTVTGDSIIGQAAVPGVISVGAVDAADPGNDTVESYSSQGPSTVYTDFSNQTKQFRQSLDGVSIDKVQTKTGQLGHFYNPFAGTSAAAPHAAAIAALVLDAHPGLSPANVAAILNSTATDIATAGYDAVSGAGRFDALAAVNKTLFPWYNPAFRQDTNRSGTVTPLDALLVINALLTNGITTLNSPSDYSGNPPAPFAGYVDVTGDNLLSPLDALVVINYLILNSPTQNSASVRLEAVDMQGNPITSIDVGQQFQVREYVNDTSQGAQGMFAAYHNVNFNASLAQISGSLNFPSTYESTVADTSQSGVLNAGAVIETSPTGASERLLYTATFTASAAGQLTLSTSTSGQSGQDILTFGNNDPTPANNVNFGSLNLNILPAPLSYTANAAAVLKVTKSGNNYQILDVSDPGNPQVLVSQAVANTSAINVTGSSFGDSVTIDASALSSGLPIGIVGGGGTDAVLLADQTNSTLTAYTVQSSEVTVGSTTVTISGAESLAVDVGSGANTINVLSTYGPTTITAGGGGQTFNVGDGTHAITGITGALQINGNGSAINFDDSANSAASAVYTLADHSVTVQSGGSHSISFNSAGGGITFRSGSHGSDVINMSTSPGNTTITAGGAGQTINLGISTHQLAQIQYPLTIVGNQSTLNIDDTANTVANTYTLSGTTFVRSSGAYAYTYSSIAAMNISTGSGNNTVTLQGSGANATAITGGNGNDIFTTGVNSIAPTQFKPMMIDGGAGTNALSISDASSSGDRTYSVAGTATANHAKLTRDAEPTVFDWVNAKLNFTGGSGNDAVNVASPGTDVSVSGGAGNDVLSVASTLAGKTTTVQDVFDNNTFSLASGQSLEAIQGDVILNGAVSGGATRPSVTLDDSGSNSASSFTYTFGVDGSNRVTLTRAGVGVIHYQGLLSMLFKASLSATNTINVSINDSGANTTEIQGGDQNDAITVSNEGSSGTFILDGKNGDDVMILQACGSYTTTNLYGGGGNDDITVGTPGVYFTALHDIYADGGSGSNILRAKGSLHTSPADHITDDNNGTITIDGGEGNSAFSRDIIHYTNLGTRYIN